MIGLAGLLAALFPVWHWFWLRLDDGSGERAGLFVLVAVVGFLIHRRPALTLQWNAASIALTALYFVSYAFLPPLIRAALALGLICAVLRLDRVAPALCPLLMLSLPVIATVQFYFGYPLRLGTASVVEGLLHFLPLEGAIARHGTVLWWEGHPIGVDPPCSGVQMLWSGLFLHFALATLHYHSWRRLALLTPPAVGMILLANVLRGFLLVFQEAEVVSLPAWMHIGTGVLVFGGMALLWARLCANGSETRCPPAPEQSTPMLRSGIAIVVVALAPFLTLESGKTGTSSEIPPFPESFEGERLVPIPLSDQERSFSRDFPGALAVFETRSGRRVIFRQVVVPTRKLHSSADCLRAVGYRLEGRFSETNPDWQHWRATHPVFGVWQVRERIGDDAQNWSEVSAWYWSAFLRKCEGPWLAVTVMERA